MVRAGKPIAKSPTEKEQHKFLDYAKRKEFAKVKAWINKSGAYVNAQPAQRWSALHHAAKTGDKALVKFLLAHGADVRAKTKDGKTAWEVATPSVKYLVKLPKLTFPTLTGDIERERERKQKLKRDERKRYLKQKKTQALKRERRGREQQKEEEEARKRWAVRGDIVDHHLRYLDEKSWRLQEQTVTSIKADYHCVFKPAYDTWSDPAEHLFELLVGISADWKTGRVNRVRADSQAALQGVKVGSIMVTVNGKPWTWSEKWCCSFIYGEKGAGGEYARFKVGLLSPQR